MTDVFLFDETRHRYTLNGLPLPSVTRVLAPLDEYADLSQGVLAKARKRGTAVHLATEIHDGDQLLVTSDYFGTLEQVRTVTVTADLRPYVMAWQRFLADSSFEVLHIEYRTYSSRYRYAGTIDRLGLLNGKRAVLDIKTTAVLDPKTAIQLAAYQHAVNEHLPLADAYSHRYGCQLKPDGSYRLEEYRDAGDWDVFRALLTIHNWRVRYRKERDI